MEKEDRGPYPQMKKILREARDDLKVAGASQQWIVTW
jgi:hypothetical protein